MAGFPKVRLLPPASLVQLVLLTRRRAHAELQLSSKQGAFCEYVRVPARLVLPKPAHVRTTEAAGLAMAGNTAYRALFHELELQPGQRLFINGGSTAVGMHAIQLARAIGCTVTVSASGRKEELLRSLGAENVCR